MLAMREKAAGADLLLCPELQLTGYPPEDLVLKPALVRAAADGGARGWSRRPPTPGPAMLFGTVVERTASSTMRCCSPTAAGSGAQR